MKRMNALAALLASAVLGLSLHPGAIAQDKYPTRPLQMVVPFPPGGVADIVARAISPALEKGLGNPHTEVLNDPEVLASWATWRDMDVHVEQLTKSKGRAVEKTMWFPEWNWQMMTEVQEYIGGKREIGEVIDNLVKLVADLKELYPET